MNYPKYLLSKFFVSVIILIMASVHISKATIVVGDLEIPSVLSDNMMIPRDKPVNIWGKSINGTVVNVSVKNGATTIRSGSSVTNSNGDWLVTMPSIAGSFTVYTIEINAGVDNYTISNVLCGELWVSGGQSNMALQVQYAADRIDATQNANNSNIRLFTQDVPPSASFNFSYTPLFDVVNGAWTPANSESNVAESSAVSYAFAKKLFENINSNGENIPVGIVNTATGATSIHTWLSRDKIESSTAVLKNKNYIDEPSWNTVAVSNRYNQMTAQYNAKVAPVGNLGVNGIIWYQGENNVGAGGGAYMRLAIKALAEDWSNTFGSPTQRLPFVFAMLTPHYYRWANVTGYTSIALAETVEGFYDAYKDLKAENDNVAIAPTYDVDLLWDQPSNPFAYQSIIHPVTKKPVGERMALLAEKVAFSKPNSVRAPEFNQLTISGNTATITFLEVGTGLKTLSGNKVRGFTICGSDLKYVDAEAIITSNNTIQVSSPYVSNPIAVTYAFTQMNQFSNLCNSQNIPAVPFRTDRSERRTSLNGSGALYNLPQEWMWCDAIQGWQNHAYNAAAMNDLWSVAPISSLGSASIGLENTIKSEGNASLKVSYTSSSIGETGFGPKTNYVSLLPQNRDYEQYLPLAAFGKLSVDIYNPDGRVKELSMLVETFDGETFYVSNANSTSNKETISGSVGWNTLTFNLGKTYSAVDGSTVIPNSKLLKTTKIQLIITDQSNTSGIIYVDHLRFSDLTATVQPEVIKSTTSGGFFMTGSTWVGGVVPTAGDNIEIVNGATVTFNSTTAKSVMDAEIKGTLNYIYNAGPLTINGNLNILSSGRIDAFGVKSGTTTYYGKILTVLGNLNNDGVVDFSHPATSAGSGLSFSGTQPQTIEGSGVFMPISYLNIINSAGVTLRTNLNISRMISLQEGTFYNEAQLILDNKAIGSSSTISSNVTVKRNALASVEGNSFEIGAGPDVALYIHYLGNGLMTETGEIPSSRSIYQLLIDNVAGVNLLDNLKLLSAATPLVLTNGNIRLPDDKSLDFWNTFPPSGSSSSFVEGAVSVRVNDTNLANVNFPIGVGSKFKGVMFKALKSETGVNIVKVKLVDKNGGSLGSGIASLVANKRWELTSAGSNILYQAVTLNFGEEDITDINRIAFSETIGGAYGALPEGGITSSMISSADGAYTKIGYFSLASTSLLLPVGLISFNGKKQSNSIQLIWETSFEENNKGFILQRLIEGNTYKNVSEISTKGSTTLKNTYVYNDYYPQKGNNYYKLLQQDLDGKIKELSVLAVYFGMEQEEQLKVYPNPVEDRFFIEFVNLIPEKTRIVLTDLAGKVILDRHILAHDVQENKVYQVILNNKPINNTYGILQVTSKNHQQNFKLLFK